MLPTADAAIISELLAQTFGLPVWQIALTATDANRFALRLARTVTNRPKILVFHGCYHGTVDETFVRLKHGKAVHRPGLMGQFTDLTAMTEVVEFNDIDNLRDALEKRDIACVITEPVLTNSSMVLPDPGYHDALRTLTRETETLLLIDETHTISSGYGGYTRVFGLEPDIWVCGKAIAGGVPTAVWGMTREVASQYEQALLDKESGHSGMGTTLSANALSLTALRASLEHVMTPANYRHMETLAGAAEERLRQVIERHKMPWHVIRVGARVELVFSEKLLKNGTEAEKTHLPELEGAIHIGLLNQGVLIAPFHNMMLISPKTTLEDVDRLVNALDNVLRELSAG
jgi:glutamate-1-semialdehyde 2,1-aminomutase